MVEMALASLLLFTLLFGIVEFGLAFKDRLSVANSTQAAARVGTGIVGTTPPADFLIVEALRATLSAGVNEDAIAEVWIYKAQPSGEPVDPFDNNLTNIYTFLPNDTDGCPWNPCPDPAVQPQSGWLPAGRNVDITNLDNIGVRVFFTHTWVTGFLGYDDVSCAGGRDPADNSLVNCWAETSVLRMEPQSG